MRAAAGTALYAVLRLACELREHGRSGSIVTLLCDGGGRYADTYGEPGWVAGHGWDLRPYTAVLERAWRTGEWTG